MAQHVPTTRPTFNQHLSPTSPTVSDDRHVDDSSTAPTPMRPTPSPARTELQTAVNVLWVSDERSDDGHVRPHRGLGHGPHHGHVAAVPDKDAFNDDISSWNTATWQDASTTEPIGSWNTSSVTTMAPCSTGADAFNQAHRHRGTHRSPCTARSATPCFNQTSARGTSTPVTNMMYMFFDLGAGIFNRRPVLAPLRERETLPTCSTAAGSRRLQPPAASPTPAPIERRRFRRLRRARRRRRSRARRRRRTPRSGADAPTSRPGAGAELGRPADVPHADLGVRRERCGSRRPTPTHADADVRRHRPREPDVSADERADVYADADAVGEPDVRADERRRPDPTPAPSQVPTPVPTIVTEFTLAPPELAVTQDKPGIATARFFIVNNGDHDLNASIADASIPTGLEWSATGDFITVSKGEFAEVELTFTTAGLAAATTPDRARRHGQHGAHAAAHADP